MAVEGVAAVTWRLKIFKRWCDEVLGGCFSGTKLEESVVAAASPRPDPGLIQKGDKPTYGRLAILNW